MIHTCMYFAAPLHRREAEISPLLYRVATGTAGLAAPNCIVAPVPAHWGSCGLHHPNFCIMGKYWCPGYVARFYGRRHCLARGMFWGEPPRFSACRVIFYARGAYCCCGAVFLCQQYCVRQYKGSTIGEREGVAAPPYGTNACEPGTELAVPVFCCIIAAALG